MGGNNRVDVSHLNGCLTIQRALEVARNSEGSVDPSVGEFLEQHLGQVWTRVQAAPDTYILTKDEFALFNFYRARFASSSVAQRAVQRFWEKYEGSD